MKNFRPSWKNVYTIGMTIFVLQAFVVPTPLMAQNVAGLDEVIEENSEFLFGFSGEITTNSLNLGLVSGGTASVNVATNPIFGIPRQGWWSGASNLDNSVPNSNYLCGDLSNNGTIILNNFFTFDISGLHGQTVTSAQFNVLTAGRRSSTGRSFHTYSIFDVSTPTILLNSTQGFSAAIHLDLASGVNYGNFDIPLSGPQSGNPHLTLNSHAIADINSAISAGDQFFSIGGTLFPVTFDGDGDGIPDDEDCQPDSDFTPTVVIDGCDSGVENVLLANGCTLLDLIWFCADDANNHGQFVRCVVHLTNEWKQSGLISEQEKGQIHSCLAQADIPGDLNGDGIVNVTDLLQILAAWGSNPGHAADINGDRIVNVTDLLTLLANWG